jgi:ubiquitin carboxyl-terminal hydrolase 22/27/51
VQRFYDRSCYRSMTLPNRKSRRRRRRGGSTTQQQSAGDQHQSTLLQPPPVKGLANLGNTCYFNVTMQCIMHAPPSRKALLNVDPLRCPKGRNGVFCVMCCLHRYTIASASGPGVTRPQEMIDNMGSISCRLASLTPHDAHEGWVQLVDALDQAGHHALHGQSGFSVTTGHLTSRVTCLTCGESRGKEEPFDNLTLPVSDRSLVEALAEYTRPDVLEGVYCPRCDCNTTSKKQLLVENAPELLVLHNQRFAANPLTGVMEKIKIHVPFPVQLDLQPFISKATEYAASHSDYELSSVIVHHGDRTNDGHYYAYCKHAGTWYNFNDSQVTVVSEAIVLAASAYMVFYAKSTLQPDLSGYVPGGVLFMRVLLYRDNSCTHCYLLQSPL